MPIATEATDVINDKAKFKLHAVIAHKGTSTASGHYVCYVNHETEGWILFNDEKVVKLKELNATTEGIDLGYVYIWKNTN